MLTNAGWFCKTVSGVSKNKAHIDYNSGLIWDTRIFSTKNLFM